MNGLKYFGEKPILKILDGVTHEIRIRFCFKSYLRTI